MKYLFYSLIYGLFLLSFPLACSDKKEPTVEEKKQWVADAEKWKRITTALQGKMAGKAEDNNSTNTESLSLSEEIYNKPAKL